MKRIQLLRPVKIDGIDHEPGLHAVEDGYAESLCNAGWAKLAPGKAKGDEPESSDDDAPASTVARDDDAPVPEPTPAPKRTRKR
jgi:hypothetical protein